MSGSPRPLGSTGFMVSVLGFGAMQVGSPEIDEERAGRVLNAALDAGINLIDTARSYGLSEERIGRHLLHRRGAFILSTKVGYGVAGVEDWTPRCVTLGIEQARARLRSDVIDIVHLHSCDSSALARPALVDALLDAVARGTVRVAAYSGDNEAAGVAVNSGSFGVLQTSLSLCDQRSLATIARCGVHDTGVLVKRPLAGLPWLPPAAASDPAHREYRSRFEQLRDALGPQDWPTFALRFAAFAPGVSACLVGGADIDHLDANLQAVARGPLAADDQERVRAAFAGIGGEWPGLV